MNFPSLLLVGGIAVTFASPLSAQDADTDRLHQLLEGVPQLPMVQHEVNVTGAPDFQMISAVTADEAGNIYVLNRTETGNPIVVLDASGRFLRSWGAGMFTIPHGIRIDPDGNVWTVDSNTSAIYKFTSEGTLLLEIHVDLPEPGGQFCGTADIAFGANGHAFVADGYCNGRVIEFDEAGQQVNEWGSRGTDEGQFVVVHSIAVSPDGIVYVADRENGRLQWFTPNGELLGMWQYAGQLFSVAFSPTGDLYISLRSRGDTPVTNVVNIDRETGKILGRIEVGGHELAFGTDGTLWPGTGGDVLISLRPSS